MYLDRLRTFLAVYRCGSITAAAESLGLSQPAVTGQVKALEARLGPLFTRQSRTIAPTPAADTLARRVADPLDALESVLLADLTVADTVQLGGPAELMSRYVVGQLAPLAREGVRLRFKFGLADELLDQLATGRLDLVVSTVRPRRRGVQVELLTDEEFVMVAAPTLAATLPDPVDAAALASLPWIAYAEDLPIVRRFWRTVFGRRPSMTAAVVIPDLRGILAAVLAGAGASVLPSYVCADDLAAGRLTRLVTPEVAPINTGYLAAHTSALNRPAVVRVHDQLLGMARTQSWS